MAAAQFERLLHAVAGQRPGESGPRGIPNLPAWMHQPQPFGQGPLPQQYGQAPPPQQYALPHPQYAPAPPQWPPQQPLQQPAQMQHQLAVLAPPAPDGRSEMRLREDREIRAIEQR